MQESLWRPKPSVSRSAACARRPDPVPLPSGCCEFATGVIHEVCLGRTCSVDGCYCSPAVFAVAKVFMGCSVRLEKLKLLQEQS